MKTRPSRLAVSVIAAPVAIGTIVWPSGLSLAEAAVTASVAQCCLGR
jgi:hypothetical protein